MAALYGDIMTDNVWTTTADDLRARVLAEPAIDADRPGAKVKMHEAEALGWKFKAFASEHHSARGSGRMWMMTGARSDEPDDACLAATREFLKRLSAGEPFCSKPISRGRDGFTGKTIVWTWGWPETIAIRAAPDAAPKVKVGRNDPCPCGSGIKFKRCCGGSDS